jgi:hypothetical protein
MPVASGGPGLPESHMSRILLMQSILAHMALLAEKYPHKAASPVAKRAKRAVKMSLKATTAPKLAPTPVTQHPLRRAA